MFRIAHMATPAPRCSCCYARYSTSFLFQYSSASATGKGERIDCTVPGSHPRMLECLARTGKGYISVKTQISFNVNVNCFLALFRVLTVCHRQSVRASQTLPHSRASHRRLVPMPKRAIVSPVCQFPHHRPSPPRLPRIPRR